MLTGASVGIKGRKAAEGQSKELSAHAGSADRKGRVLYKPSALQRQSSRLTAAFHGDRRANNPHYEILENVHDQEKKWSV